MRTKRTNYSAFEIAHTITGEAENLLITMAEGCRQAGKNNVKSGGAALTARKLGKVRCVCLCVYVCVCVHACVCLP
jgi:hypothetical protein